MKFKVPFNKTTEETIRDFERTIDHQLPEEYRGFLLEHNGGAKPVKSRFYWKEHDKEKSSILDTFYGLGDVPQYAQLQRWYSAESVPNTYICIGYDQGSNQICLSLNKTDYGTIYFWNTDWDFEMNSSVFFVASSFTKFIDSLLAKKLQVPQNDI